MSNSFARPILLTLFLQILCLLFCSVFGSGSCIGEDFIDEPLPDGCCSQDSSSSNNICCWKNSAVIAKDNFVPSLCNEVLSIIQPLNFSSTISVITRPSYFDARPFLLLVNQLSLFSRPPPLSYS